MTNRLSTTQTAFGLKNLLGNISPLSDKDIQNSIPREQISDHIRKSFIRHASQLFKYKEPFSYDNLEFLTNSQGRFIPSDNATETDGVKFEIFQRLWDLTIRGETTWQQFDTWFHEANQTVQQLRERGAFRGKGLEGW